LKGVIGEIAPVGDPNSRTFLGKLDVPQDSGLRSGVFGRVAVPSGEYRSIYVPETALRFRGQLEQVFVVEQGIARLRLVRAGKRSEGNVEITSGIVPGDMVVVDGVESLVDGQPLEVRP
jgi:RND family efflux transporter MFP subunit